MPPNYAKVQNSEDRNQEQSDLDLHCLPYLSRQKFILFKIETLFNRSFLFAYQLLGNINTYEPCQEKCLQGIQTLTFLATKKSHEILYQLRVSIHIIGSVTKPCKST